MNQFDLRFYNGYLNRNLHFVLLSYQPIEMNSSHAATAIESVQRQTNASRRDGFVTVITTAETILTNQPPAVSIANIVIKLDS